MNLFSDLFSDTFIYALGWTLLQSLWFGAVIAFLILIILVFLKNQNSNIRYNVTVISMLSVVLLSAWTFISYYNYYDSLLLNDTNLVNDKAGLNLQNSVGIFWLDLLPDPIKDNMNYFAFHSPIIFTFWFFTVVFLSIKYLGGYAYSQRLKYNGNNVVSEYWQFPGTPIIL